MSKLVSISLRIASVHGSAPNMPICNEHRRGSSPLAYEFIGDRQHVRRRHGDDPGLELVDELHLTFGEPTRNGDYRAAEAFGTAVKTETSGEQAIAVRDLHHVAGPDAGGTHRPGHDVGPHVKVVPRVADHGGSSGGAARRVDSNHLPSRHREHAEGIVAAEIVLDREREPGEILQRFEIGRAQAGIVET